LTLMDKYKFYDNKLVWTEFKSNYGRVESVIVGLKAPHQQHV
jgi:hypothetical protein